MITIKEQKKESATKQRYGYLWSKFLNKSFQNEYHYNYMQDLIPERIVRGGLGLEVGCGCGWDLYLMAKVNPSVRIIGMDLSGGVYPASLATKDLPNANVIKGSGARIPLKSGKCDFVYSFGVVHHMPDYNKGFLEIRRVLKQGAPCFLYLYEDHSDNRLKYIGIRLVSLIRRVTVKLSPKMLYAISYLTSPVFVVFFSYPARIFKRFKQTMFLYEKMPFNFGTGPFSLAGDLYDRFSAPVEHRFSRNQLLEVLRECGFGNIQITRFKETAGWVVWGYKI